MTPKIKREMRRDRASNPSSDISKPSTEWIATISPTVPAMPQTPSLQQPDIVAPNPGRPKGRLQFTGSLKNAFFADDRLR